MKLVTLTLPLEKPPELKFVPRTIDLRVPNEAMKGWIIAVRGPRVILIAPKGAPKVAGAYEIARSVCVLGWDSTNPAEYDKQADYTSDPIPKTPPLAPAEEQS